MKKVVLNGCYGGFSLSEKAYNFLNIAWDGYGYDFMNDRENPKLVECVEKLGEDANGSCANLYIEEYDDENFIYEIDDYDGCESLILIPVVSEKRLVNCNSIYEIVEYLKSLNITVV